MTRGDEPMEQNPIRLISATQAGMFIGCSSPTFRRLALDNPDSLRPVVTPSGLAWQVEDVMAWCDRIRLADEDRRDSLLVAWGYGGTKRSARIRPALLRFAESMEERLCANDHKGGWNDEATIYLFRRLKEEVGELEEALKTGSGDEIRHECADAANFAMMIADVLGG